ncbi:MAG: transglutaminase family protein, partial [Verrucomicrobia bacterium]|nr:transglutaminase family protein [Verrucomicrobiota bacterium]
SAARFDGEFLQFILSQGEHFDLEEGIWGFTRTTYPDTNVLAFQAQLDDWAAQVRTLLTMGSGPGEALDAMNEVLFERLKFRGNEDNFFDPANSYLNRVMDRRIGIPISLSAVYLLVAKRVRLPITGIGMPAHFLCRYQTPMAEVYIDPFHKGQLLTRLDCRKRLLESAIGYDERHLAPLSSRRTLQRMIANLHLIHKERRNRTESERLQRYLVALSR